MDNNEGPAQIDNKADRHAERMAKKKAEKLYNRALKYAEIEKSRKEA